MRVENPLVSQSLIESPRTFEKKEVSSNGPRQEEAAETSSSRLPSAFGSTGVYSPGSLRAAVDYHAKYLTVAENNMQAVLHPPTIPKGILDRLSGR